MSGSLRVLLAIFIISFLNQSIAQEEIGALCVDSLYCIPSVEGRLKPKGVLYENEFGLVKIKTDEKEIKTINHLTTYKLKLPIINRDDLRLAFGLFYFKEDYRDITDTSSSIAEALDIGHRDFDSYGFNTYILKPYIGDKYLSIRTSISVAGPLQGAIDQYLKYSVTALLGRKKNNRLITGWGGVVRYSMGRYFALPIYYYIRTYDVHWSLRLQLPVAARLSWTSLNKKNVFLLESKFSGGRYFINYQNKGGLENGLYSSTDMRTTFTYEREIYDFLWINFYTGYKVNILSNVFETESSLRRGLLAGVSIFMVPPRRFSD